MIPFSDLYFLLTWNWLHALRPNMMRIKEKERYVATALAKIRGASEYSLHVDRQWSYGWFVRPKNFIVTRLNLYII